MTASLDQRVRAYSLPRHLTDAWEAFGPLSAVIRTAAAWFATLSPFMQGRPAPTPPAPEGARPPKRISVWFPADVPVPLDAPAVVRQVQAWIATKPEPIRANGRPSVDSSRIFLGSVPKGIRAEQIRAGLHLAMSEPHHFPAQPRAERGTARAERKAGETRARTFTVSDTERDWLRANVTKKGGSVSRSLVTWAVTVTG